MCRSSTHRRGLVDRPAAVSAAIRRSCAASSRYAPRSSNTQSITRMLLVIEPTKSSWSMPACDPSDANCACRRARWSRRQSSACVVSCSSLGGNGVRSESGRGHYCAPGNRSSHRRVPVASGPRRRQRLESAGRHAFSAGRHPLRRPQISSERLRGATSAPASACGRGCRASGARLSASCCGSAARVA